MWWLVLVPVAYLIGTFPSAVLIAKAKGHDIRSVGSGNPGASNVIRVLGWRWGGGVMAFDMAKGALAAAVGLIVAGRPEAYLLAAIAVIGHVFPIGQHFRGGKGVATSGGAFCVLSPAVAAVMLAVWLVVSRLSKKASLASIVVVTLLPVGVWIVRRELWEVVATIGICGLVMVRHWGNVRRLLAGDERDLSLEASKPD